MRANQRVYLGAASDESLVGRVHQGDRDAFGVLVERHYGLVRGVCVRILGNRDDALEASQDVFLKAFQQIGTLRQAGRLRGWLVKIARNHALAVVRRRRHVLVEFHSGHGTTAYEEDARFPTGQERSTDYLAAVAEMKQQIRQKIAALTENYETIIRLHYLDGCGLAEIADRLNIPTGTAKWRLWRAKAMLRKELMMDELTDQIRNEATANPLLVIDWVYGSSPGPQKTMETLLAQQILFCLRKELKTPRQIATEVKADVSYVSDHLAKMTCAEILTEEGGMYRANCILFDKEDIKTLREKLVSKGQQTAEVIAGHCDELSGVISTLSPSSQGFDEDYLRWLILPTMVVNFGISRKLADAKGITVSAPARPDGGRWFYLPCLVEGHMPAEIGCNYHSGRDGHGQYWNTDLGVTITRPTGVELTVVRRLSRGPVRKASLVEVFSTEAVAAILDHGLARGDGDMMAATVPVFTPADGDILDPVISRIAEDVVDRVHANCPDDIYAILDSLGFSFIRGDYPAHLLTLAQMGAVAAMVAAGALQPAPSPCPPGWGFFAWEGTFAPMERHR